MGIVQELKEKALTFGEISREEALLLAQMPLEELAEAAEEIRRKKCGQGFDLCTIVNGKCGRCSEDCKYCAQSAHYQAKCTEAYGLLPTEKLLEGARHNEAKGVLRYSVVTSGRNLSDREVEQVCESIRVIREETNIQVCVSFGLLEEVQFRKIREAGASRVHCNLESSAGFFPKICTTHTYQEKINTLKAAKRAGLSVCSGGILGLGETMEDRIDMILTARELGVKSVPVNFLNPIPGTPLENRKPLTNEEARRCVALFRFLIPEASIRLAGGRGLLGDKGEACFRGGANAAISGDMLTTAGITVETDRKMVESLGFEVKLCNE
ncbi:biotin synthase BioB [Acetatifactor muris]|uniref:Biotin synthase n=1 Tax=Acetatifactor muris TaxID=879566 RepID=A0A2K4ZDS2_9FIRM|nr:biotin synthase BioB [Acetatifactor muris]MCI8798802.1 biotin synthase BioB [Lachnospiraceae bacterium]MCR2046812.1 biotin synthase BioB [Acetatifactor muris]SOY28602.1 Biotin synthase [Acetatifactor muris]